jgi:hypothetical protein
MALGVPDPREEALVVEAFIAVCSIEGFLCIPATAVAASSGLG